MGGRAKFEGDFVFGFKINNAKKAVCQEVLSFCFLIRECRWQFKKRANSSRTLFFWSRQKTLRV